MKTIYRTLFIAILLLAQHALTAQNCTAAFSFDGTDQTIQFMDESTVAAGDQIVSWFWDFGDG